MDSSFTVSPLLSVPTADDSDAIAGRPRSSLPMQTADGPRRRPIFCGTYHTPNTGVGQLAMTFRVKTFWLFLNQKTDIGPQSVLT